MSTPTLVPPKLDATFRDRVGAVIAEIAAAVLAARACGRATVVTDGPEGPTTNMDIWAQRQLVTRLGELLPGTTVVAEEGDLRADLVSAAPGAWVWVIDPIDGTSSYASGLDTFGVQVALCAEGTTVGGWIDAPALGWRVRACADSELVVEGVEPASAGLGAAAQPRIVVASGDFDAAHRRALAAQSLPARGTSSCAVDYAALTAGLLDGLIYRRTYPWDHAPGTYLATRAGACALRWDASAYRPCETGEGLLVLAAHAPADLRQRLLPHAGEATSSDTIPVC